MKAIDKIIQRLQNGEEVDYDERRVIGYILKECRAVEIAERKHEVVHVQMSPEMYQWYIRNAFNDNGQLKINLAEEIETVNFNQ